MDEATARAIGAALEVASYRLRGATEGQRLDDTIRDIMATRDVPEESYDSIMLLVSMLFGFADAVRMAERNGNHIIPLISGKGTY